MAIHLKGAAVLVLVVALGAVGGCATREPARYLGAEAIVDSSIARGDDAPPRGTLILLRHAERDDAAEDGLLPKGRDRAALLAKVVADARVDEVLVSDMARTVSTAKETVSLYQAQDRPVVVGQFRSNDGGVDLSGKLRSKVIDGRVVLVVAHSDQVANVLRTLGKWKVASLRERDFDFMFIVVFRGEEPPVLIRAGYPPRAE